MSSRWPPGTAGTREASAGGRALQRAGRGGVVSGVPSTAPGGGRRQRVFPQTRSARFTASLMPTWPACLAPEWFLLSPPVNGAGPDGGVAGWQQSVSGTCHPRIPTPAPSRPAYLLRNVPLQPLRRRQHEVRLAPAVPSVRVAQVEGVSGQDKLQGAAQAESVPIPHPHPLPAAPCPGPVTSQRCPMIGASAQACSVLRPNWPFLKATRVKDLSNHLWEEELVRTRRQWVEPGGVGGAHLL